MNARPMDLTSLQSAHRKLRARPPSLPGCIPRWDADCFPSDRGFGGIRPAGASVFTG
jgi:hypothetical protein